MQHFGSDHHAEDRPQRKQESAGANRRHHKSGEEAFCRHAIDQRAGGDLQCQTRDRPDRQNETDVKLRPRGRCQIDGNERAPSRLNISNEKSKPIEAAKATLRRLSPFVVGGSAYDCQVPIKKGNAWTAYGTATTISPPRRPVALRS